MVKRGGWSKKDGDVYRREFRLPAGYEQAKVDDCAVVVTTEALHRGLRPTGEPYIEDTTADGDHQVVTWAVSVEENV